jgi:hypothetical protein
MPKTPQLCPPSERAQHAYPCAAHTVEPLQPRFALVDQPAQRGNPLLCLSAHNIYSGPTIKRSPSGEAVRYSGQPDQACSPRGRGTVRR